VSVNDRGVPFNVLNVLNELNHREVIDKHTSSCCAGCVHNEVIARQHRGRWSRQNLPTRGDRKRLEKEPGLPEAAVGLHPAALLAEPGGVMAAQ